jgi:hypothetical protein
MKTDGLEFTPRTPWVLTLFLAFLLLVSATAGVDQEGAAPAKPDNAD